MPRRLSVKASEVTEFRWLEAFDAVRLAREAAQAEFAGIRGKIRIGFHR